MTITNPYSMTAVNTAIGAIGSTLTFAPGSVGAATITSNSSSPNTLQVRGDIDVQGGDISIDGVSLKQVLESITERLHILTPDPQKLEKFEALKRAYEQYKLLEKLCHEDKKD